MKLSSIRSDDVESEAARLLFIRSKDLYEFVAFVCWYILLVLCCIVPTACAYRRGRRAQRLANAAAQTRADQEESDRRAGFENSSEEPDSSDDINSFFFPSPEFEHEIRNRRLQAHQRRMEAKRDDLVSKMATTRMVSQCAVGAHRFLAPIIAKVWIRHTLIFNMSL